MKISLLFSRLMTAILLLSFFFVNSVYAADCAIKSGMSEELTNYIKAVDTIVSKIGDEASKKQCNPDTN